MIFIPGEVPSSKNSKRIIFRGRHPRLISSKATQTYKSEAGGYYEFYRAKFLNEIKGCELPLRISFRFIRKSKRKFDLINIAQIVQDMMVEYEWIEDDNYTQLIPVFKDSVVVNPKEPGVIIGVLKSK